MSAGCEWAGKYFNLDQQKGCHAAHQRAVMTRGCGVGGLQKGHARQRLALALVDTVGASGEHIRLLLDVIARRLKDRARGAKWRRSPPPAVAAPPQRQQPPDQAAQPKLEPQPAMQPGPQQPAQVHVEMLQQSAGKAARQDQEPAQERGGRPAQNGWHAGSEPDKPAAAAAAQLPNGHAAEQQRVQSSKAARPSHETNGVRVGGHRAENGHARVEKRREEHRREEHRREEGHRPEERRRSSTPALHRRREEVHVKEEAGRRHREGRREERGTEADERSRHRRSRSGTLCTLAPQNSLRMMIRELPMQVHD